MHRSRQEQDAELAPWMDTLLGGDAGAGRRLFEDRVDLSCRRCHAVDGKNEGHGIRPNLAGVSARLGRLGILESIVAPNRRTTRGYDTTAFHLGDEVVVGRVISETDAEVVVLDADGNEIAIGTGEIESRKRDLSAMPDGLAELLSPREMRDLIEYLARL